MRSATHLSIFATPGAARATMLPASRAISATRVAKASPPSTSTTGLVDIAIDNVEDRGKTYRSVLFQDDGYYLSGLPPHHRPRGGRSTYFIWYPHILFQDVAHSGCCVWDMQALRRHVVLAVILCRMMFGHVWCVGFHAEGASNVLPIRLPHVGPEYQQPSRLH